MTMKSVASARMWHATMKVFPAHCMNPEDVAVEVINQVFILSQVFEYIAEFKAQCCRVRLKCGAHTQIIITTCSMYSQHAAVESCLNKGPGIRLVCMKVHRQEIVVLQIPMLEMCNWMFNFYPGLPHALNVSSQVSPAKASMWWIPGIFTCTYDSLDWGRWSRFCMAFWVAVKDSILCFQLCPMVCERETLESKVSESQLKTVVWPCFQSVYHNCLCLQYV